ncbi:4Fe-4S dicluster domain-containing protein [Megalodesulfovibrio gigas]|uniref:Putative 4Fe-4S ferredoxin iron-sulfur binding domain-containing protein n=1 Tax=Megalodesulfovibrio gigas (strain ATCC 19364 / DSM 1382 / NCIMB 9332 / VKM B-1759) TaxID=1121448 RepID=T2G7T0_MEGG1|nr:4Fe-4S dicluster domain-containing protein [Megalodesulfovibrio gigas]AGW12186.1 putative 4Fe-4S ferredoxin iron-sulfur binding domain-containing protein [Megalodesulfovibrio gigas DSM 1382 = ATCC 19364]
MGKQIIKFNANRCISCYACEMHCKAKNKVPEGAWLGKLVSKGPVNRGGKPRLLTMYMTCFHCAKAWCIASCPTGAMTRDEQGLVHVQSDLCVGCKACIQACPWSIPQWDDEQGKAIKCDFCRDRLAEGLKPACVTACCAHALEFVDVNENSNKNREAYAQTVLARQERA